MKLPDYDIDMVSASHKPAAIREGHPIGLAYYRCAHLAQHPHLFQGRNHQLDALVRGDQCRIDLLIIESLGLICVYYVVAKPNDLTRLHGLDTESLNSPDQSVKRAGSIRHSSWLASVWGSGSARRLRGLCGCPGWGRRLSSSA